MALLKEILLPGSEVDVALRVHVHSFTFSFLGGGFNLAKVLAFVVIVFDHESLLFQLVYQLEQQSSHAGVPFPFFQELLFGESYSLLLFHLHPFSPGRKLQSVLRFLFVFRLDGGLGDHSLLENNALLSNKRVLLEITRILNGGRLLDSALPMLSLQVDNIFLLVVLEGRVLRILFCLDELGVDCELASTVD